jgi:hypothetical protein
MIVPLEAWNTCGGPHQQAHLQQRLGCAPQHTPDLLHAMLISRLCFNFWSDILTVEFARTKIEMTRLALADNLVVMPMLWQHVTVAVPKRLVQSCYE